MKEHVRILLAEDNDDDVVMLRQVIGEAKGLRLMRVVADGEEAMAYLRKQGPFKDAPMPELVVLDIKMPRKNGFEVLSEIKADPALRHLPVIILTTSQQEDDIRRSHREGACLFITKPVGLEAFHEMVKRFERYWTFISRTPSMGAG